MPITLRDRPLCDLHYSACLEIVHLIYFFPLILSAFIFLKIRVFFFYCNKLKGIILLFSTHPHVIPNPYSIIFPSDIFEVSLPSSTIKFQKVPLKTVKAMWLFKNFHFRVKRHFYYRRCIITKCCSFEISIHQRILENLCSFHKNIKLHNCFQLS